MKRLLLPLCLLPLLAACNPRADTDADDPTGHVWQSQVDRLEQARSAGQQAAAAARQTDQQLQNLQQQLPSSASD